MPKNNPVLNEETVKKLLSQFQTMDNESLRDSIARAAQTAGINPRQIDKTTANLDKLKQQVSSMSERDLHNLASHISPDKINAILAQMKSEGLL